MHQVREVICIVFELESPQDQALTLASLRRKSTDLINRWKQDIVIGCSLQRHQLESQRSPGEIRTQLNRLMDTFVAQFSDYITFVDRTAALVRNDEARGALKRTASAIRQAIVK